MFGVKLSKGPIDSRSSWWPQKTRPPLGVVDKVRGISTGTVEVNHAPGAVATPIHTCLGIQLGDEGRVGASRRRAWPVRARWLCANRDWYSGPDGVDRGTHRGCDAGEQ